MSRAEAKERRKEQVLAAVEASIRKDGTVNFSMRELADKADVSFATPFNLFGKKEDILAALFNKRVTALAEQTTNRDKVGTSIDSLLRVAIDSCEGYLSDAELFKPLAQSFRTQSTPQLEAISNHAQSIWKDALADCLADRLLSPDVDLDALARQLHIGFRVAFWMWATEELTDDEFRQQALSNAAACLLTQTTPKGKKELTRRLSSDLTP